MISDRNRVYDGWFSLEGGVDGGRVPVLLAPNQCASAENMTFRGGHPAPRPGFRLLAENFSNPNHSYFDGVHPPEFMDDPPPHIPPPAYVPLPTKLNGYHFKVGDNAGHFTGPPDPITGLPVSEDVYVPTQVASTIYKTGNFQGAIGFSPHHGDDCIMAMIGGRLFKIVPGVAVPGNPPDQLSAPNTARVTEIELDTRNTVNRTIAYMLQADKWLIVQDGQSLPIIYDGNKARRSAVSSDVNKTEIPTGTFMAYGMGRICVVVNDRDVAFGDLYGSHAGDDPADSLILFTERNFLAEGFDAAIPFNLGKPTGMAFFPQLDTSTGNGQLLVFAERGASAFFLSIDRTLWKTSQFQILALLSTGMRGHRSISVVNEDLWFRAEDGMRSYRQARSEPSGWAHIPLSTNVRQFMDVDTPWLLKYASSIYFDNRIIATCSPIWNKFRPVHEGMVAVDFDILSSFGQKYSPAWDGHWQMQHPLGTPGVQISQLVTASFSGQTRAFFFGIDQDGNNQLYEITRDDRDDFDPTLNVNIPIEWELTSRAFTFQQGGQGQGQDSFNEQELYDGDCWLKEIIE